MRDLRIVVVVGCQRSGTTLTGQLLGAHPGAVLIDEFDGLYPWFAAFAAQDAAGSLPAQLLTRAASKYRVPAERIAPGRDGVQLAPQVRTLVLKAPNLTYDERLLARLGSAVTVLYPVRDPRAVVTSMARLADIDFVANQRRLIATRPWIAAEHPDELAILDDATSSPWRRRAVVWRIKSGRAERFRAQGLTVREVRYEDLVRSPAEVVPELLAATGLTPEPSMRQAHDTYVGTGPGATDRSRAVDADSLTRWRADLSPAAEAEVMEAAGEVAARHGYR